MKCPPLLYASPSILSCVLLLYPFLFFSRNEPSPPWTSRNSRQDLGRCSTRNFARCDTKILAEGIFRRRKCCGENHEKTFVTLDRIELWLEFLYFLKTVKINRTIIDTPLSHWPSLEESGFSQPNQRHLFAASVVTISSGTVQCRQEAQPQFWLHETPDFSRMSMTKENANNCVLYLFCYIIVIIWLSFSYTVYQVNCRIYYFCSDLYITMSSIVQSITKKKTKKHWGRKHNFDVIYCDIFFVRMYALWEHVCKRNGRDSTNYLGK